MKRIGLIAGNGDFAVLFAKTAREKGIELVCVAVKDEASPSLEGLVDKIYWITLGEAKKLIDIFKKEGVKKAVMMGGIKKTRFFTDRPKLDAASDLILKFAKDKRDLALFKAAALVLRLAGIQLISATICLKENVARKGCLTRKTPSEKERQDIRFGYKIAKNLSGLDIGQTVVVKDKAVLAVEAIEGTDEAIKRGGALGNGGVVVVKVARPNQDMRFDIPVIGLHTITSLKAANAAVLAIEKDKTLILDKEELTRQADASNISIIVI